MIEFTELYLDERAFNEHVGSKDYLDAYGDVVKPGLQTCQVTVRMGTPPRKIVEAILERVAVIGEGSWLWNGKAARSVKTIGFSVVVSLDVPSPATIVGSLRDDCTTCIIFDHPIRTSIQRVLCTFPGLPSSTALKALSDLGPVRGEAHLTAMLR